MVGCFGCQRLNTGTVEIVETVGSIVVIAFAVASASCITASARQLAVAFASHYVAAVLHDRHSLTDDWSEDG